MRVGIGYDIHALKRGRKLLLGGVKIPHPKGLSGHSDGDALIHAIVDAALGAAALGDIGDHFPDSDPRWKGISSLRFARQTTELLKKKKLKIRNVDSVVVAETPKLAPHKPAIRRGVARAFGLGLDAVNVKAKTNEGFGPLGKGQAIAVYAVVTLEKY